MNKEQATQMLNAAGASLAASDEGDMAIKTPEPRQPLEPEYSWGKLTAQVPEGCMLPPYHGVVSFNMASRTAFTAVMPLHLVGRWMLGVYVWFKVGGQRVHMDPYAAFHQGLRAGIREAEENMPTEMADQKAILLGMREAVDQRIALLDDRERALKDREDALVYDLEGVKAALRMEADAMPVDDHVERPTGA